MFGLTKLVMPKCRLLKALGAPSAARIYTAGGEPFGGDKALEPLVAEFPNLVTKEKLAKEGELSPFLNKSSALAAIDYIVSLSSDVFVPSHGGNMGRAMKVSPITRTPKISFSSSNGLYWALTFCVCLFL